MKHKIRSKSFFLLALLAIGIIIALIISLFWTPYPVSHQDISHKFLNISALHWLGTDYLGRDIFSRIIVGLRNSLTISFCAITLGAAIGIPLGIAAALNKKFWERIISHFNDLLLAFPVLITAMLITTIYGGGTMAAIMAIGIFNIPVFARLTRGAANQIIQKEYILAAQALGKTKFQIAFQHIIPNLKGMMIIQATSQMALAILAEAALSYLGLGIQPPYPSLGNMLNQAQSFLYIAPHLALYPGISIIVTAYILNRFSNYLRDTYDPKIFPK